MSANTPRAYGEAPIYSENLLPALINFSTPIVWNTVQDAGAGTITPTESDVNTYKRGNSLLLTVTDFEGTIDASGGFSYTATNTSPHILSMAFFVDNSFIDSEALLICKVTKNASPLESANITVNLKNDDFFTFGEWNLFYERFNLVEGDVLDFSFYVKTITGDIEIFIDRIKLDRDDKNLITPSIYSLPIE